MHRQKNLKKLIKFADKHNNIAAFYIFGSVATGRDTSKSDLDLAMMIYNDIDGMQRIELETLFSNLLGCDVDLVIFSQSSPLLQHQILKYGKLIYEGDVSERVRQEVFARTSYFDTKFLFKKIDR
ncbi:Nucleotidyltransferase domain-containing protein [Candidatus Magnetomoraceae bacterium gMMP-15]